MIMHRVGRGEKLEVKGTRSTLSTVFNQPVVYDNTVCARSRWWTKHEAATAIVRPEGENEKRGEMSKKTTAINKTASRESESVNRVGGHMTRFALIFKKVLPSIGCQKKLAT